MAKKPSDKPRPDKLLIEPPKPRKRVPPPSRPLKDRRKETGRRKTREKIRPDEEQD